METESRKSSETTVAPEEELRRYLGILRRALVLVRNHGVNQDAAEARFYGHLADVLHNLPDCLLAYGQFEEDAFWRDARGLLKIAPAGYEDAWEYVFREAESRAAE